MVPEKLKSLDNSRSYRYSNFIRICHVCEITSLKFSPRNSLCSLQIQNNSYDQVTIKFLIK
jgi:hypothetical protein